MTHPQKPAAGKPSEMIEALRQARVAQLRAEYAEAKIIIPIEGTENNLWCAIGAIVDYLDQFPPASHP